MEGEEITTEIREVLARAIDALRIDEEISSIFFDPIDIEALGIPDYPKVIKRPMCFLTLKNSLELNQYKNVEQFFCDAKLIFNNCRAYNAKVPFYINAADKAEEYFGETVSKYCGMYLEGFTNSWFKTFTPNYNDFNIYSSKCESMAVNEENYEQIIKKINSMLCSVAEVCIGETVDYYLRCKNELIEYGDQEIEFVFNGQKDYWLVGNICTLLENKLMDGSRR